MKIKYFCFLEIFFFFVTVIKSENATIGFLYPRTGGLAFLLPQWMNASELAINQINARGILNNVTLNWIEPSFAPYTDETTDPSVGIFGALDLANRNAVAVIGAAASAVSETAALVLKKYEIPQISPSSTSDALSAKQMYPYFLRTCPPDSYQAKAMADFVQYFGWRKVAIIGSSDSYGANGLNEFLIQAEILGLNVLGRVNFNTGASSFTTEIQTLKSLNARIIILFCLPTDAINLLQEAYDQGILGLGYVWIGSDGVASLPYGSFNSSIGFSNAANGLLATIPTPGSGPLFQTFLQEMGLTESTLAPYTSYVYDAIFTVAYAMNATMSLGLDFYNGSILLEQLNNTYFLGVTGVVEFDKNLDRLPVYDLLNWKFGEWQSVNVWTTQGITKTSNPIYWPGGSTTIPSDSISFQLLYVKWNDPLAIIITVLAILFIIVGFVIAGIMFVKQSTPVVKFSSPLFVYIIIFGILLGISSVFPWIGEPSVTTCELRLWLVAMSFVLVCGPLFSKTWRIWRSFNSKAEPTIISAKMLLAVTGTIVGIQAIILILWSSISPIQLQTSVYGNSSEIVTCYSPNAVGFLVILILADALLLIFGIFISFKTRKVPTKFRESKLISFCIYQISFIGLIVIVLGFILGDAEVQAKFFITTLGILVASFGTLLTLFLPKIYIIFFRPEKNIFQSDEKYTQKKKSLGSGTERSGDSFPQSKSPTSANENEDSKSVPLEVKEKRGTNSQEQNSEADSWRVGAVPGENKESKWDASSF